MYGTTRRQENCWFGRGIRLEGLTLGHRLETIKDFKFRLSIQNKVYLLSMFKNDPLSFSYLLQKVSMKLGLNETFKNVKFLYFKGINIGPVVEF